MTFAALSSLSLIAMQQGPSSLQKLAMDPGPADKSLASNGALDEVEIFSHYALLPRASRKGVAWYFVRRRRQSPPLCGL